MRRTPYELAGMFMVSRGLTMGQPISAGAVQRLLADFRTMDPNEIIADYNAFMKGLQSNAH